MSLVVLLVIVGVVMVRSAALTSPDGGFRELSRQIAFGALGIPIVLIVSAIDYRLWGRLALPLYGTLIILLLYLAVVGEAVYGASRWIPLFGGLYNLQPSEIGKFIMVLSLGHYLVTNANQVKQFGFMLKTLVYLGVPVAFIALQPDISTCILYGVIWLTLMWLAGMRWEHVALLGIGAGVIGIVGFFVALQSREARYIAERLVFFILPDPTSAKYLDATYNINQALISVGAGGWFGQGYGVGSQVQLRFLKVRHTDYIFATIANELGFVGGTLVVILFVLLILRIYWVGLRARDTYGQLICFGVGTILMFEAFSNIASTMNILPVTGSPLPLVSYGGSSLWTYLVGIGLVESVILRHKQIEF